MCKTKTEAMKIKLKTKTTMGSLFKSSKNIIFSGFSYTLSPGVSSEYIFIIPAALPERLDWATAPLSEPPSARRRLLKINRNYREN